MTCHVGVTGDRVCPVCKKRHRKARGDQPPGFLRKAETETMTKGTIPLSREAVKFLDTYIRHKMLVQSRTDPTCWYMVDVQAKTCECLFYRRMLTTCWHLEQAIKFRKDQGQ